MENKFSRGKDYLKNLLSNNYTFFRDSAERYRENKFAFVVFINLPYYFELIEISKDIISIICWLSISIISLYILFLKNKFDDENVNYQMKLVHLQEEGYHKAINIEDSDENSQISWCKKYTENFDAFEKDTEYENYTKKRKEKSNKMDFWRNIAVAILIFSAVNQSFDWIRYLAVNGKLWPDWLKWLVMQ